MSRLSKLVTREHAAYQAHVAATAAVVTARIDGLPEADIDKLARRAQAYRTQWLALARQLELTEYRAPELAR
ncbi:hypothetical protein SEA_PHINKY_106 [Microbacterium phage Phinky]|nr:hypothetical protein SEA_PHINKY_106 [Microbacterium phage Phinky]